MSPSRHHPACIQGRTAGEADGAVKGGQGCYSPEHARETRFLFAVPQSPTGAAGKGTDATAVDAVVEPPEAPACVDIWEVSLPLNKHSVMTLLHTVD